MSQNAVKVVIVLQSMKAMEHTQETDQPTPVNISYNITNSQTLEGKGLSHL